MSLLKDKIFRLALDYGVPSRAIVVEPDSFRCPEPNWISNDFGDDYARFLAANNIRYTAGSFECRDYALLAVTAAKLVWLKTPGSTDDALAFGMLGMLDMQDKINFAVHRRVDGTLYLRPLLPQDRLRDYTIAPEQWRECGSFQLL